MVKFVAGAVFGAVTAATVSLAFAQMFVEVPTNGVLKGYIVQKNGKTVCKNPEVYNQFRGPDSYIICP